MKNFKFVSKILPQKEKKRITHTQSTLIITSNKFEEFEVMEIENETPQTSKT